MWIAIFLDVSLYLPHCSLNKESGGIRLSCEKQQQCLQRRCRFRLRLLIRFCYKFENCTYGSRIRPYTITHGDIRSYTLVVQLRIRRREIYFEITPYFFTMSVYGIRFSSYCSVYAHPIRSPCTTSVYLPSPP